MATIEKKNQFVHARIRSACEKVGRDPREVKLLAVSKTQTALAVREAYEAGQRDFGENYVLEGVEKKHQLAALPGIAWHFIGPLQSNKSALVAQHFDWMHSLDRLKIAQRLSAQRPEGLEALQVCIQVNIDHAPTKSGIAPEEVEPLARAIAQLPRLRLRGLMTVPDPGPLAAMRLQHQRAHALFEALRAGGLALDTLSMGMSEDLEAAIEEGATIVRVGSALFGSRAPKSQQA